MNNSKISIDLIELAKVVEADRMRTLNEFCKLVGIKINDEISQREAFNIYGRSDINRWEATGSIMSRRIGAGKNSKIRYSKSQIEYMKKLESIFLL